MNESNHSDDALAELLTLTVEVDAGGNTIYRDHSGHRHRIHGPAMIFCNGGERWFNNGRLHRTDGPAVIWDDGETNWYQNGELHRVGGPAVVYSSSSGQEWYSDGLLHREDGPAIEYSDGYATWYLNGEHLTKEEFNERVKSV